MKIPKSFKLMGRTITVTENPRLLADKNWCGAALYGDGKIELLPINEAYEVPVDKYEQTFCHELAHWLIYYSGAVINHHLGEGKYFHDNEEFIDLLGSLLHQYLVTAEYKQEEE